MYAVIKTGGKQHKVQPGDVIEVELMHGIGETVTFQPLLVVDDDGTTHYGKEAARAVVTAKPVGEQKGDKVKIFKYKNKTGYARKAGHRQLLTLLEISTVSLGGAAKTAAKKPAKTEEPEAPADVPADAPAEAEASE
jgi:large subunit ribosomal protein L21